MKNTALFNESNRATYCPEDDKLRLYVGRVPRPEYDALRAEGWTATAKQDCDFVAVWTVSRKDTAESYAGIIEDEDASPADRAADRAERFAGYLGKRLSEAQGHADRYDATPSAHGAQDFARAVKSADRHDRYASRAVDAWDKAEYWQRRTAGVIDHALYRSEPGVRMGRIKTIEADLRKAEKDHAERIQNFATWQKLAAIEDPAEQTAKVLHYVGHSRQWAEYRHPRAGALANTYLRDNKVSIYSLCSNAQDPITGAEACTLFFSDHTAPGEDSQYIRHLKLRVAYELQMLDQQGGRAALVEMEVGGWIDNCQIRKVNKSSATGRVVSVQLGRAGVVNIERASVDSYRAPTEADKLALKATIKAEKAAAPVVAVVSLVNPTLEDAEKLQELWNAWSPKDRYDADKEPAKVAHMTQAQYSASSGGYCARVETVEITGGGKKRREYTRDRPDFPAVAKVRRCGPSVVVLSDKPQKALPAAVWHDPRAEVKAEVLAEFDLLREACRGDWLGRMPEHLKAVFDKARLVGWSYVDSQTQFGLTAAGEAAGKQLLAV